MLSKTFFRTFQHSFRAVTTTGPSAASGSGFGGAGGAGAGFHPGRGFYQGYHGYGRALTQATNTSSQADKDSYETDDDDFLPLGPSAVLRRSRRLRSRSFSAGQHGHVLAQLRTEQKRTFSSSATRPDEAPQRPRSRSNSTSAASDRPAEDPDLGPPPLPPPEQAIEENAVHLETTPTTTTTDSTTAADPITDATDSAPATSPPPPGLRSTPPTGPRSERESLANDITHRLDAAQRANDHAAVQRAVFALRNLDEPTDSTWAAALQALLQTAPKDAPITDSLELYNDMLARGLKPTPRIYSLMIHALCQRDAALRRALDQTKSNRTAKTFQKEDNFGSARAIFALARRLGKAPTDADTHNVLLRSCAQAKDIDTAIQVFSSLEELPQGQPDHVSYLHMLQVYTAVADLEGATVVFEEFQEAIKEKRLELSAAAEVDPVPAVWNAMISTHFTLDDAAGAVAIFERMLSPSEDGSIPSPNSATISTMITGFAASGDVDTALAWLNRILATSASPAPTDIALPRPDSAAYLAVIRAAYKAHRIDDAHAVWATLIANEIPDNLDINTDHIMGIVNADMKAAVAEPARAEALLEHAAQALREHATSTREAITSAGIYYYPIKDLIQTAADLGKTELALRLTDEFATLGTESLGRPELASVPLGDRLDALQKFVALRARAFLGIHPSAEAEVPVSDIPLDVAFAVARMVRKHRINVKGDVPARIAAVIEHHRQAAGGDITKLGLTDETLALYVDSWVAQWFVTDLRLNPEAHSGASAEQFLDDLVTLLGPNVESPRWAFVDLYSLSRVVTILAGRERAVELFAKIGTDYYRIHDYSSLPQTPPPSDGASPFPAPPPEAFAEHLLSPPATPPAGPPALQIDESLTASIQVHQDWRRQAASPLEVHERLMAAAQQEGRTASPEAIGLLVNQLGRLGEADKAKDVYLLAHGAIAGLGADPLEQARAWFEIEDQMVVALAHAGDMDGAGVHRIRIVQSGGVPSADAYAACISNVKETTDDASIARELWDESQRLGVRPNVFLYNTIISKLSRARKANLALELFNEMKGSRLKPTSVTYGAVINACTRIGDEATAEQLFQEMSAASNFKPRVPPYNTMMQFYTQTKPNRERALFYFQQLVRARVPPSAHTYKLLLDAYGAIAPVDRRSLREVFDKLVADVNVEVTGAHWASLIHSAGCVEMDLERAQAIFEGIAELPSSRKAKTPMPDAVAYEALLNVFVTLHRTDLIPDLLARLTSSGIHPTAYINNLLIKGFAASGNIDSARAVFESMTDPNMGVAAAGNHPSPASDASIAAQVQREPSTWETMVRAEMGAGEIDRARALVARMEERLYPLSVTLRISSVLGEAALAPPPAPSA